jgi:hypothetical protein
VFILPAIYFCEDGCAQFAAGIILLISKRTQVLIVIEMVGIDAETVALIVLEIIVTDPAIFWASGL